MSGTNHQRGFTLIAAIFLVVVLAALITFMLTLSGTQHFTTMLSLKGAQAHQAANSGIEWGIRRALDDGGCFAGSTFPLTGDGLTGFTVTVSCSQTTHPVVPVGDFVNIYAIEAFAESGSYGNFDYVSRRISAEVADLP